MIYSEAIALLMALPTYALNWFVFTIFQLTAILAKARGWLFICISWCSLICDLEMLV